MSPSTFWHTLFKVLFRSCCPASSSFSKLSAVVTVLTVGAVSAMVLMDSDDVPSLVIDLLPPWLGVSFVLFFSARLSVLLRLPELDLESGFRFLPKVRPVKGKILVKALELIFDIHLTKRHFSLKRASRQVARAKPALLEVQARAPGCFAGNNTIPLAVYVCVCAFLGVCACLCVCARACMCASVHVCACLCVCACMCVRACMYVTSSYIGSYLWITMFCGGLRQHTLCAKMCTW